MLTIGDGTASSNSPWLAQCINSDGKNPKPLPILANACVALEQDPRLCWLFAYDEMLCTPTVLDGSRYRPVTDADIDVVQKFLQECGLRRLGPQPVAQAIGLNARRKPYHPVREYLLGLEWDEQPRTNVWAITRLGCEFTPYSCRIGQMFLLQMVARVLQPGCKADYMLVLEGPQGPQKSTALETLAGPYFSDSLPDLDSDPVRISMHLRGKWLIEVSELHAFSRAETTKLKAFLTSKVEQYTPKFGRHEVREPRQCVFAGTSNKDTYLRDETGNRRYWPLKCGLIMVDELAEDRDQLFAETVRHYHNGAQWWPERSFEQDHIEPQQGARYEHDAWIDLIENYLADRSSVTLLDLAVNACGLDKSRVGPMEQRRITAILRVLEWLPRHSRHGNYWERPREGVKAVKAF